MSDINPDSLSSFAKGTRIIDWDTNEPRINEQGQATVRTYMHAIHPKYHIVQWRGKRWAVWGKGRNQRAACLD